MNRLQVFRQDDPQLAPSLLSADRLCRNYPDGRVHALTDVSFRIERRQHVAIMGPSGCGKSTLLNLLGGLDRPTSGAVYFQGQPLPCGHHLDAFRARRLGFVFQSFCLIPTWTAQENVLAPMLEGPFPSGRRKERAAWLLEKVGMAHRARHLPCRLSVGERQRVAIARALANDPELILADEPTGNLDSQRSQEILDLFDQLRGDFGKTLIVVTHSDEVAARADRILDLKDGRLQRERRCVAAAPRAWAA